MSQQLFCILSLSSFLALGAASWQCAFPGFVLNVNTTSPLLEYSLTSLDASSSTSAVWLEGGSLAVHRSGSFLTPGNGGLLLTGVWEGVGVDNALGQNSFLSASWADSSTSLHLLNTSFHCFPTAVVFEAWFPEGLGSTATLPLPPQGSQPLGGNSLPSTHFPSFAAGPSTLLRSPQLGYGEWAGCMSVSQAGFGLSGYRGGSESGPLLLVNRTQEPGTGKPLALVWGPLAHFSQEILALVADPSGGVPHNDSCAPSLPHTDQEGAVHSPGYETGVHTGSEGACCAVCEKLGYAACDGWAFDTSGTPTADCWPCLGVRGSKPAVNRSLGLMLGGGQERLAGGVQGYATSLPPGFTTRFALVGSPLGATAAVMEFGALLRTAFHTVRMAKEVDPMRRKMSYWTDNGAYYEDDYWAKFFTAGNNTPQKILTGLKAYHASAGLHFGTYQLDPWWSDGDGNTAPNWYWAANWTAAPGYFPDGLESLGMPLTLYSNLYATPALNQMTQFSWLASTVCQHECYSRVYPNASYAFHSYIFDLGLGWGQNAFEIDFLNFMALSFSDTLTDVRAWDEYWDGMNRAAVEHGFSVQMCMDLPSLAMGSVQWPAVTNARLQGDGFPTDDGRYDIFQSSLLYAALDIAPFLDNIWTTACQPGEDNPFNGDCEPYVEALMVISVLSAGPVGLGDAIGMTNLTLAMSAVRGGDGVLLQPSLPATPIDAYYCGLLPPGSRVAAAPSFIPTSPTPPLPIPPYPYPPATAATYFTSILAIDLGEAFTLRLQDTTPPLPPSLNYVVTLLSPGFDALSDTCRDGAHVFDSGCGQPFNASTPLTLLTPAPTGRLKPHDVYTVSPMVQGGWVLLGELRKITRVSPTRFASLTPSVGGGDGGLEVGVVGAPGESVDVALVAPSGTIKRVTVVMGAGPGGGASAYASISCTLTGEACTVGALN